MLRSCLSVEKSRSGRDLTISVKRMVFGLSWVSVGDHLHFHGIDVFKAWLNIIAAANRDSVRKVIGITDLLHHFYAIYGRSFFSRYDYEEVPSEGANALIAHIENARSTNSLLNTTHLSASTSTSFTISGMYDFEYKDPIDHSVSKNQGQVIQFSDGSRVVFRLSGTGSQGATVRMYVERYVGPQAGKEELSRDTAEGLKGLIEVALAVTKLKEFLGVEKPTVITVSVLTTDNVTGAQLFPFIQ